MLAKEHTFVFDVVNESLWVVEIWLLHVVLVVVAVLLILLFRHRGGLAGYSGAGCERGGKKLQILNAKLRTNTHDV